MPSLPNKRVDEIRFVQLEMTQNPFWVAVFESPPHTLNLHLFLSLFLYTHKTHTLSLSLSLCLLSGPLAVYPILLFIYIVVLHHIYWFL